MTDLKKYNLDGKETGTAPLAPEVLQAEAHGQMVKDYIVALRANARQWSACTRDRSEVSHSNKKPHRQKGTGRARQGSLASPQYKGGGVVFGPRPQDKHVRINARERRQVIQHLFGQKAQQGQMCVLEDPTLERPHTKRIAQFLKGQGLKKRVLFVMGSSPDVETNQTRQRFAQSIRNIPRTAATLLVNVSGYDLMRAHDVILTESALEELNQKVAQGK